MNYLKHYNLLIKKAQNRLNTIGYFENHHIVPKCMGGENISENIVKLTAAEHYIAHQLLVKIYPENTSLIFAAMMMTGNTNGNRANNKVYKWLKEKCSSVTKGVSYDDRYGKETATSKKLKTSNSMKGVKKSDSHKESLVKAWTERQISNEHKAIWKQNGKNLGNNKAARLKAANTRSSEWIVTDPEGTVHEVKNLRKFCRDNNLPFQSVYRGFKGWNSEKININSKVS